MLFMYTLQGSERRDEMEEEKKEEKKQKNKKKPLPFLTKLNFIHKGKGEPGDNILFSFIMLQ